jgi:class 3 adenylate cyclase/tetratricopeptide (TPR) repeat protein
VITENVVVLFTDIVGSTELSQRLSVEAADEVRRAHFSILRQAITESGGLEVKNLGDGLMAVLGSASAALGCAVSMQQGVEQGNRGRSEPVGLRVGLSVGEASHEDEDYFGDPVVEAARLCAACESGQILATDLVRAMAGRRNSHECRAVGPLTLKGLPDTVETVEVTWTAMPGDESSRGVPLPGRLAVRPPVGVIGREVEAAAINDAIDRVTATESREILLVSGEAGLGKTTLVADAARAAFDTGACVLFGHCEEDLATPYQLFAEALGHYVTHASEEQLLAHVEAHGSELSRLVPALASRIPDLPHSEASESDTERFLLFAAVVGLLTMVSKHDPVVLVLDDLQWADRGSLLLLRHVAAADPNMRVLVLATYRENELSNASALVDALAALRRLDGIHRIDLVGLDGTGVRALIEAGAGHGLDDAAVRIADAIYQETDGNPFFVSEVLRDLIETRAIGQDLDGRWVADGSLDIATLPDSVRDVIAARVLRLGKDAGRVISVASVIGRDFDLDLLARATDTDEDDLLDILEAASTAALVREPTDSSGRYAFCHAMVQHTVYDTMGPNRRARAHRQVAEALEDLCGDRPGSRVGELARHWIAATHPPDLAKAIGYSRLAGDAALDALAPADALRHYTQALGLQLQVGDPDPPLAIDLAIGLGTAQRQTGDPAYRDTLLQAARQAAGLGDIDRLASAALATDRGIFSALGDVDSDKVAILETALAELPADHPDRALVLAQLCQELSWKSSLERRLALAEEAIGLAKSANDEPVMVRVLCHVLYPLRVPQLLGRTLSWSADALDRAERIGDPLLMFWAASRRSAIAGCAGDVREMDRCLAITGSLAERLNQPVPRWVHTFHSAARSMIAGDSERAEQLATEALRIGTDSGQPDAFGLFGPQFMAVIFQRGRIREIVPIMEDRRAADPDSTGSELAAAYAETDRFEDARRLLDPQSGTGFELREDLMWTTSMVWFAEAAIECRHRTAAGLLFDRLSPYSDQLSFNGAASFGPISHYVGALAAVLGRYDEADAYFSKSASFNQQAGATFFAARTDLLWARMLAERQAPGDTQKARDLLAAARSSAATHGYENVERRATAAIHSLG